VVSVELGGDRVSTLSMTTDAGALLDELGRLRQQTPALSATGLTHLVTGRSFDGGNAGIAYTDALCSRRYAASISTAHTSTALDTLTIAHEIGHVFGAPHDGVQQCEATPQGQYIMTPTINTSISTFSQCSIDQIKAVIDSYSCVVTLPPPSPVDPPPPAPPPAPPAADGDGGGSGSLDPTWLFLLLALRAKATPGRNERNTPA
jgi:hypothetical protein